jgi:hypothetical protein
METINQPVSTQTTDGQRSGAPQRKGGFVQGAAVAQGCCGETGSSGGCCGAPAQAAVPVAVAQGCCGETGSSGGCCGAPAQAAVPVAVAQGCCDETGSSGGCCSAPAAQSKATASFGCCS